MTDALAAFHFLRPWWLLLVLAAPAALMLERARQRDAGGWRGVVAPHLLDALLIADGTRARLRPAVVAAILFPLLAIALAGPSWRREPNPFVTDRAPMVVALDLSRAGEPALAAGKRKIRDLVAARAGARTGLIAYAGSAHPALPPTDDPGLIESYLDALSPQVMPRDGSAAAEARNSAFAMLADEPGAGTVVFVTPGIPATEAAAFRQAAQGSRHGVLVLATGDGPFDGAPGAGVVEPTPDAADVNAIVARAQRHFALAPTDDPAMRWRDAGPWVALLLVPVAGLFARRGFLAVVLVMLALGGRPAMAAGEGDLGWFWRLWLTSDQRAQLLMNRGEPARAAALFTDPVRRGAALYAAGDYEGAANAFAQAGTAEAAYDRGNALMMRPQGWNDAIPAYDRALQLRPGFAEATDNRAVAAAFQLQQQAAEAQREANQTNDPDERPPDPDQIVQDQPRPPNPQQQEHQQGAEQGGLSDADIQSMWMRRVGGTPADFLRQRFARQAAGQ
ncbi:VWA domain-containing protein [Roseomonas terrae]|uniref:VWA domain-containing protein n=1 Tax=Neoroseomonas terrae TaxID=424799 RepID=A0ABS5EF28_9PROT|nr:VWA domain-containing protein [Neoroseomonas terrae]MBR0649622.1 VWA domain-containing protein [Neoroseomonas terrae]